MPNNSFCTTGNEKPRHDCNSGDAGRKPFLYDHGGIIRGDTTRRCFARVFTGGDYHDGGNYIRSVLQKKKIRAGFFFTGDFYRNPENRQLVRDLIADGHYLGPHSDKHLLYCAWKERNSLLVTKEELLSDLQTNYQARQAFAFDKSAARYFMRPYEWYNATISNWAGEFGLVLVNFSPETLSNPGHTLPSRPYYRSSEEIFSTIIVYEETNRNALNGLLLLLHLGTHPERTDKFYFRLQELVDCLQKRRYAFVYIDELL